MEVAGHIMASFDSHGFCARCREKGKGSDPCISHNDCNSCNILTEDQRLQLSTPSYRLKKEKHDLKKTSDTPKQDSSSSSLIDPSSVTVVGAVDDQGILQSPGSSSGRKKKANPSEKPKAHSSKDPKTGTDKASKSVSSKSHRSSPDARIDELDQKWAERFNRLEALLLAKSLDKQEPAFTTVKVTPAHSPPPGSVISTKPFIRPFQGTDSSVTDLTTQIQATDQSQGPDTAQQSSDLPGNVQTANRQKGKVLVTMPTDEWLCSKMGKLNLTLTEGYPSRSSEAGGLLKDQFVRLPKSQSKWYSFVPNPQKGEQESSKAVTSWSTDASKVNSTYSRIAKAAGIASTPPASRQISQYNLRRWEKSAREASIIYNQAAGFNRCLYKVQDNMQSQLKVIKSELSKGKSSGRVSHAADELQFLMNFNSSIPQSMAKTLEHLTDFVFVTVANTTLARRDSYLSHLKMGIKPDTLAALRTAPLQIPTLFPDSALKQSEQDIVNFESKGQVQSGKKGRFHLYKRPEKRTDYRKPNRPAWKNIGNRGQSKKSKGKALYYSSRPAKGQQSYK